MKIKSNLILNLEKFQEFFAVLSDCGQKFIQKYSKTVEKALFWRPKFLKRFGAGLHFAKKGKNRVCNQIKESTVALFLKYKVKGVPNENYRFFSFFIS